MAQTDECLECTEGFKTGQMVGATSCESCDPGTYSRGLATNCRCLSSCQRTRPHGIGSLQFSRMTPTYELEKLYDFRVLHLPPPHSNPACALGGLIAVHEMRHATPVQGEVTAPVTGARPAPVAPLVGTKGVQANKIAPRARLVATPSPQVPLSARNVSSLILHRSQLRSRA